VSEDRWMVCSSEMKQQLIERVQRELNKFFLHVNKHGDHL